jgi:hypothetical protein
VKETEILRRSRSRQKDDINKVLRTHEIGNDGVDACSAAAVGEDIVNKIYRK